MATTPILYQLKCLISTKHKNEKVTKIDKYAFFLSITNIQCFRPFNILESVNGNYYCSHCGAFCEHAILILHFLKELDVLIRKKQNQWFRNRNTEQYLTTNEIIVWRSLENEELIMSTVAGIFYRKWLFTTS